MTLIYRKAYRFTTFISGFNTKKVDDIDPQAFMKAHYVKTCRPGKLRPETVCKIAAKMGIVQDLSAEAISFDHSGEGREITVAIAVATQRDGAMDKLTASQFNALAELLRVRNGASGQAAHLVLVEGLSQAEAGRQIGLSTSGVGKVVQRMRRGLKLAQVAVQKN